MSTHQSTPQTLPDLQFDRATFDQGAPPSLSCQLCETAIVSTYFDVNRQPTCPSCCDQLVASAGPAAGWRGLLAAAGAGFGAAVAGALLYYAVLAVTGYEIGLIAVVVGLMVGNAVKWGAGRGGRRFQVLAVTLTYLAIVSTYVPFVIAGIQKDQSETQSAAPTTTPGGADAKSAPPAAAPAPSSGTQTPAPAPQSSQAAAETAPTGGEVLVAVALMIGVLLALPFLAGLENVIGWVIIGFALWEAWKVNRPVTLEVTGPFEVAAVPPPPPPPPVPVTT